MAAEPDFEAPLVDLQKRIDELVHKADAASATEAAKLRLELDRERRSVYAGLTPWQKTLVARHPNRPYTLDFIQALFTEFTEVHGDRRYGVDLALVGGLALYMDRTYAVLGLQKCIDTKQMIYLKLCML